jgi:hypothetical protein
VAVVVDGIYADTGSGRAYQPRSAEDIEQLTKLVKSAVGYDEARGDKVELVNLRFIQGAELNEDVVRPMFGLEKNDYIRIGVLPEIGGRIFEGFDKTNNYHFFYRQHVIKPALIGLIGAWISGGIE